MLCQDSFLSKLDAVCGEYAFLVQIAFVGWRSSLSILEGEGAVGQMSISLSLQSPYLWTGVHVGWASPWLSLGPEPSGSHLLILLVKTVV